MKFGIFYELQLPRPWEPGGELRLYQNALDQVELADRLGYDYAWEVEHHFLEEYSHSPAPEVFLAAASQRTKRIRLAHGIMQLTTNHPARCAERIAALDLVSNGRVEFGTGESASITELEPFGVNFDEKRAIWEEGLRAVIPMLTQDRVEHHGKYFDMPLRNVVPKPVQKPHPPLWVACSALETIEMAGRRGLGALAFQFLSADAAHARALSGGLIGSPETLRRKLLRFETSNIDQVILLNQAGKNTHEHICESLELFAREVMPELHAKIPEHEEWKQKVLVREIELEEIDTQPFRDRYGPNSVQLTRPQAAE